MIFYFISNQNHNKINKINKIDKIDKIDIFYFEIINKLCDEI